MSEGFRKTDIALEWALQTMHCTIGTAYVSLAEAFPTACLSTTAPSLSPRFDGSEAVSDHYPARKKDVYSENACVILGARWG